MQRMLNDIFQHAEDLNQQHVALKQKEQEFAKREAFLKTKEEELNKREALNAGQSRQAAAVTKQMAEMKTATKQKEEELNEQQALLKTKGEEWSRRHAALTQKEEAFAKQQALLKMEGEELNKRHVALKQKEEELNKRQLLDKTKAQELSQQQALLQKTKGDLNKRQALLLLVEETNKREALHAEQGRQAVAFTKQMGKEEAAAKKLEEGAAAQQGAAARPSIITVLTPALDALRKFDDDTVGPLRITIQALGKRCDELIFGLQRLKQVEEVAPELSSNPFTSLTAAESDHSKRQRELQKDIDDLQYKDDYEPLVIDRMIQDQLRAYKAFNVNQEKAIKEASELAKKVNPTACDPLTASIRHLVDQCKGLSTDMEKLLHEAHKVCDGHRQSCKQQGQQFVKEQHHISKNSMDKWTTALASYIQQREKVLESDKARLAEKRGQAEKCENIDDSLTEIRKEIRCYLQKVEDGEQVIGKWKKEHEVIANLRDAVDASRRGQKRPRPDTDPSDEDKYGGQRKARRSWSPWGVLPWVRGVTKVEHPKDPTPV